MPITTTAELGDTIPTVIEEARFTSQFLAIMAGLSWKITKQKGDGKKVNVPYWGEVTAVGLTEGVDMTASSAMDDTNVQITPAEVGVKIILTDKLIRDDQEDVKAAAGKILGSAMEKKRDQDLLGQLDDGTNSLGGAGTTMSMGVVAAARALLAGNKPVNGGPAPMPYACVHHPFTLLDLVDVLTPLVPPGTAASSSQVQAMGGSVTDDILRNYGIGKLFGMPIMEDGNLSIDASDDAKGGVFATGVGGSIILATANEWSVEPERDASLRGWELNIVGEYGVGEYLPGWIVELYMDAATPA
ncbi:hypothetical protein CMI37_31870 [Candidatus Pacearchaeota archaeon]|nr:hypothetical protein [Candidatus Pacearchaeota archaeon]|tara:strand:- start:642 stop:1544 length:903 start_codon:yes stop_codon:yes gene_type:complete